MAEGNRGVDSAHVIPTMTHEEPLAVANDGVLTRVVEQRRMVFVADRHTGRHPPAGIDVADEHVDECLTEFLATEPDLQHCRRSVQPVERVDAAGIHGDYGARVRRCHTTDQLGLVAGKRELVAVASLGLPIVVRSDDEQRDVAQL